MQCYCAIRAVKAGWLSSTLHSPTGDRWHECRPNYVKRNSHFSRFQARRCRRYARGRVENTSSEVSATLLAVVANMPAGIRGSMKLRTSPATCRRQSSGFVGSKSLARCRHFSGHARIKRLQVSIPLNSGWMKQRLCWLGLALHTWWTAHWHARPQESAFEETHHASRSTDSRWTHAPFSARL